MKKSFVFPIIFVAGYILILMIGAFNSGGAHDLGTGLIVIVSLPLGAIGLILESYMPNFGLIILSPIFGCLQYVFLGYFMGRHVDRRSVRSARKSSV
jgi:hypothetical protein